MAKRVKEPEPEAETGLVKMDDPALDTPAEVEPVPDSTLEATPEQTPEPPPAPKGPSAIERIRRFFNIFFRLVFWVILFTIFGAALYYGLPMLYQKFIVPVERNTAQTAELQTRQKQLEEQLVEVQTTLSASEAGQAEQAQSLIELDKRMSEIETDVAAHTKSLAALEKMQSELQTQDEMMSAELQRQINLMKSMELLSRARLYMYQSNFGFAKQDVQSARDLLVEVQPSLKGSLADDVDAVIRRLELALSNLPSFPVAASDDLDIAWQILITGLPEESATLSETPIPISTPSPTLVVTFTPTAVVTATP